MKKLLCYRIDLWDTQNIYHLLFSSCNYKHIGQDLDDRYCWEGKLTHTVLKNS